MKKKVIYIVIVILLLIATATGFFFIGRASYKNSLRGADYPTSEKNDKKHKTYTLNDTIKTNCYEICFTGLYLQDTICIYNGTDEEIHEDFFKKPIQHEKTKVDYRKWHESDEYFYSTTTKKAPEGEIFATIEYTIKNTTTEPIEYSNLEATNKFQLIYDDEYTFTDETPTNEETYNAKNNNFFSKIYVQKDRKDANGNIVKGWSNTQNDFKLNPLDEPITIREYIRVSDNILKDNKSVTIKKYFRKDNKEMYTTDTEPIYVKTTINED